MLYKQFYKGITIVTGELTSTAELLNITTSGEVTNLNANYLQGYEPEDFAETVHTHVEVDITDLDHDAVSLQGTDISSTSPGDQDILTFSGGVWIGIPLTELEDLPTSKIYGEDLTDQVPALSGIYILENEPLDDTLRLFVNGIRQRPRNYSVSGEYVTPSGILLLGDDLLADYDYTALGYGTSTYGSAPYGE